MATTARANLFPCMMLDRCHFNSSTGPGLPFVRVSPLRASTTFMLRPHRGMGTRTPGGGKGNQVEVLSDPSEASSPQDGSGGQIVGLAHGHRDLVEFLRRAGLDDAWDLFDDAHWIEWRGIRAHRYEAA